jgi:hypothetical protein
MNNSTHHGVIPGISKMDCYKTTEKCGLEKSGKHPSRKPQISLNPHHFSAKFADV